MYGLIHVCLQHMVKTKFGEENWKKVLADAGLDGKSYLTFRSYPDEETLQLIVSSAKVLGFTLDEALELLGDHFLLYVMENGYEEMLRGLGSNFLDFIQNINYLHWYLMSTAYPGIVSPSFVCSPGAEEGDAPILDYYSNRMGMHPLSNGLLRAIGRDLFQMSVEFEFLEAHEEILSPTRTLYHRRFRVLSKSMVETTEHNGLPEISKLSMTRPKIHNALPDAKDLAKGKSLAEKLGNSFCGHMFGGGGKDCPYKVAPKDLAMRLPGKVSIYGTRQRQRKENGNGNNNIGGYRRRKEKTGEEGRRNFAVSVPSQLFCKMQPYHIVFDSDNLTVVQAGTRLTQFYPRLLSSPRMDSVFDLVWPLVPLTPYNLKRFRDFVFQLAAKPGGGDAEQTGGKRVAGGRISERRSTIAEVEGIEDGLSAGRGDANGRGKGAGSEESEEADDGQPKGKRSASMGRMRHHLPPVGQPTPRGSREEGKASREDGGRGGRIKAARDGSPSTRKSLSNSNEAEGEGVDGEGEEGGGGDKIGNKGETSANNGADRKGQPTERVLILKGAIYPMDEDSTDKKDSGLMIFVGTPLLHNLQELIEKSMRLSDVPMYDSTRELVLLKHQRSTEFDLMTRLEETTMELTSTWEALRIEKQKADSLLYSMMPREVAVLLQRGERVQKSFSECTILFSDIVTFTVIASQSSPLQIIDMLNALYTEFDALTEKNDVYKVETIGDAYMVVGGVPSPSPTHAVQVSRQAVGMVQVSGKVLSPVSGLPLEIRVGLHSGPVVAGCVGLKMPRYCLFGDTVNTASRMESHGVPGKVHISGATKRALDGSDFKLIKRGDIEVKGKGIMDTYFIELPDQQSVDENVS